MRLAATLTPMRDAARVAVALRGTLRDHDHAPHEVTILDLSSTGFLAELPEGTQVEPGMRVRIATTPLGAHEAVAVRHGDGCYGFAFVRPIAGEALAAAQGEQTSSVFPFPIAADAAAAMPGMVAAPAFAAEPEAAISARASLVLVTALSAGLWGLLAAALWIARPYV